MNDIQTNGLASEPEGEAPQSPEDGAPLRPNAGPSIAEPLCAVQRWAPMAAALVSAVLATLCFAPTDAGWLAWLAYAPMIWAVRQARRPRGAFGLAYVFGAVHFGALTQWLGVTVAAWSGTGLGWIAWALLALIEGLWFGLFGWLTWWVIRRTTGDARLLLTACAWALIEWLRTLGGLAMPWGLAGYTQHRALSLIQISELVGVFGVGFVVALVNAGMAGLLLRTDRTTLRSEQRRTRAGLAIGPVTADIGVLVLPCLFYAGTLTYGMLTAGLPWNGRPINIALMQPNLPTVGAQPDRDVAMGRLAEAAQAAAPSVPSLTVWPESTVQQDAVNDPDLRSVFESFAHLTDGFHLVGTTHTDEAGLERNSAVLFGPDSVIAGRYDKQQLVPFGEWVPARFLFRPVSSVFRIPEKDVAVGGAQDPLKAREMSLGVLICYESIFPALARDRVRRGADILVSITNDSWAGRSASPAQHFAMTVFRAVETRRYVVASGLTGVTGVVTPAGATRCADENVPAVVAEMVFLRDGLTPYARWGDWFIWLCALILAYGLRRGASSAGARPSR